MRCLPYRSRFTQRWSQALALTLPLVACLSGALQAQTSSISGVVIDQSTKQPLAGAQVVIVGTQRGVATNQRGQYLLPGVEPGSYTLQVQFIGYRTESIDFTAEPGETVQLDFELSMSVLALEELVVTGTGVVTERRRLGQTIATVGSEQLEETVAATVTDVLQGRIPGLVAHAGTGETGSSSPIRLRGTVSLSQRNEPIIYVDGVRMDNRSTSVASITTSPLDDINPADIERVEIIKGAAAATLFGTEASAGVIQIFTKRGFSDGPPRYSIQIEQGISKLPINRIPRNYAYDKDGTGTVISNFPVKSFARTGNTLNIATSVQGGASKTQYFLSGRYRNETGVLPNSGRAGWSVRMGLDHSFTDKLQSRVDLSFNNSTIDAPYPNWGLLGEAVLADPSKTSDTRPYGELFYTIDGALAYRSYLQGDIQTLSGSLSYNWAPGITSELTIGHNSVEQERLLMIDRGASPFNDPTGLRNIFDSYRSALTVDFKTSWQTSVSPDINSTFVIGGQSFWENSRTKVVGVRDFAAPGLETVAGGATVYSIDETREEVINAGILAQEQVGLWDRLFVTVGARLDGNSAFGRDFGLQFYPKAGASWVVSDHSFWRLSEIGWDQLRLRAAIGTSGLQPGAFDAQRTWRPATMVDGQPVVRPMNQGNPQLKPERSVERELAAEMGFFDGRLGMEIVYFNQRTTDALLAKPTAPSLGFLNAQLTNIGELKSQGVEVSANWIVMQRPGFTWNLDASLATLDQIVTDMGGLQTFRISGTQRRFNSMSVGYQPGAVIGPTVDPDEPYHLSVSIEDFTDLEQLTPNFLRNSAGGDSLVFIGNQAPTITGSISSRLTLSNSLTLQILLSGAGGFVMMNETEMVRAASGITKDIAEMQKKLADPSTTTAERQAIADRYGRKDHRVLSHWAEPADYLRLQEMSLSYQLPEHISDRLGARRMQIALAGHNLLLLTKYSGIQDPGSSGSSQTFISNIDYFRSPRPRSVTLQVRANW